MAKQAVEEVSEAEYSRFKKKIEELSKYSGKGTELISVYIPPDADRSSVMSQLTAEVSQSSNIKSAITRKNVQGALRKLINYLRFIDFKIPSRGVVLFCGNVSEIEGRNDIRMFTVLPTRKLRVKLYWCDSKFHLDPLKEMLTPSEAYGLITIDKRESTIAVLEGKKYNIILHLTSQVPGKFKAGGQSSIRFARLREEAEHEFYKKTSEKSNAIFLPIGDKLKGMIIGGPGLTKNYFLETNLLDYRLRDKIIAILDVAYVDESGIRELIQKSEEVLKDTEIMKERKILDKFIEELAKDGLAAYGLKEVDHALSVGQVEKLLVSEALKWEVVKYECGGCGKIDEKIVQEPEKFNINTVKCGACGGNVEVLEEIDYQDWLLEKCNNIGAKLHIISTESPEGQQFFNTFGGIGAILRYKI